MKTMCFPWLLPQWLCCNPCTWAHDVRLQIAGTTINQRVLNKLSKERNINGHN